MDGSLTKCSNCNHDLHIDALFCSNCGQSVKHFHRPFSTVVADVLHEALDTDGRFLLTLKTLLLAPGRLSLDYNNGKRARYTPPLRLYLVISVIFFLILSQIDLSYSEVGHPRSEGFEYYPKIMFLLLPVFALLLQLCFRGTLFISNLVFAVHIQCFTFLLMMLMMPLESIEQAHPIFLYLQLPIFFYLVVYLVLALKRNYDQSWLRTMIKFIVLFVGYTGLIVGTFDFIQRWLV